jgi:hypothetical protein
LFAVRRNAREKTPGAKRLDHVEGLWEEDEKEEGKNEDGKR